ncbi:MAG TPA: periplasmic heavy metal sensor [Verrucomicrobiae bacterium]|nr:periplasmic heavy metal sensor [Verrucomicrobiae bacterium]
MRTKTVWFKMLRACCALATAAALCCSAHAQSKPARGSSQLLGRDLASNGRMQAYERILRVLTPEQRASLRENLSAERAKTRQLEEKLKAAREQVFAASVLDKFDEPAVRKKIMAAAKIEADLAIIRLKAFANMNPPLSADQLDRLRQTEENGGSAVQPPKHHNRPQLPHDENGLPPKQ